MKVTIRPIENEDLRRSVDKLRTFVYPDHPEPYQVDWHASVWRWLGTHPLADEMHRWVLATEEGEVVGHLGAVPQFYRIGGERVVAHTPADYEALPGYGFHALSPMRCFFRTVEDCVSCDQSQTAIKIETWLGSEVVGKLQYAAKVLDVSRLPKVAASIPTPILVSLTRGLSFLDRGLRTADGVLGASFGAGLEVEVLDGFDASFDELFESVAAAVPCVPEKDGAFFRWRYGPDSPQSPVTVLGVRDGGALLGYAVLWVIREGDKGYLLDLTTRPGRGDVARSLLRDAIRRFVRTRVALVMYRFLESPTSPQAKDMWRLGFFPRNNRRHTLLVKFADHVLHKAAWIPPTGRTPPATEKPASGLGSSYKCST